MKLDAHVHSTFSKTISTGLVRRLIKESYSPPESVYRRAKSRGMDLVTITDHDCIDGALEIAHHPDVIIGCEITAVFADDGVPVHLGVLDITEEQHREIEKLRTNIRELMPYLKQQGIFSILNHASSPVSGPITANHILALMPWVDAIETLSGARLPNQNRTVAALAEACGKSVAGGSDSHTLSRIGLSYVEADAADRAGFMNALRAGKARVGGDQCSYLTLSSDIVRISAAFCNDAIATLFRNSLGERDPLMALAVLLGIPLTLMSLVGAIVYLINEERFNRSLLFDLIAEPVPSVIALRENG